MKRMVLDASVILKWYLPDESYGENALELLKNFTMGTLDIVAPTLLEYELINGLVIARKRGRLAEGAVTSALGAFQCLGIRLVDPSEHYDRIAWYCHTYARSAYDDRIAWYCHTYARSAYDACYLALAEREDISLITADERLLNSIKADLTWVRWIGDISEFLAAL